MKFNVYDANSSNRDVTTQEYIGSCIVEPYEIVRAPKQRVSRELFNLKNERRGELIVSGETITNKISANIIFIDFEGHLNNSEKYFIKLYRQKGFDSVEFIPVYQTETRYLKEGWMRWKRIRVGAASLIKDNLNSNIKIEVYEFYRNGNHVKVGESTFVFKAFLDTKPNIPFFNNPNNFIKPVNVIFEERFSFMEYLLNGLNISMILAIDFTASNRDPSLPASLHNFNPVKNQYLTAINAVGSILECYDTDKMIPTLGFGAQIKGFNQSRSDCFALNGNIFAPEVLGIRGVIDIYQRNMMKLNFNGPTHFHRFLNYVANMVEVYVKNGMINCYFVLMIITDGVIHDINETIDEIVRCSYLPISIIIVGVGNEDFSQMELLDSDKHPLSSPKYGRMNTDMVQFVPMREYIDHPQVLACETLKELPRNVSDYMRYINANPKNMNTIPNSSNFNFSEKIKADLIKVSGSDPNIQKAISIGIPTYEQEFMGIYTLPQYRNPFLI